MADGAPCSACYLGRRAAVADRPQPEARPPRRRPLAPVYAARLDGIVSLLGVRGTARALGVRETAVDQLLHGGHALAATAERVEGAIARAGEGAPTPSRRSTS